MRTISHFEIKGLFGYVDRRIDFSSDSPITIISGPNGAGKTHILRLLNAALNLDLTELASVEYERLEVRFADRWILRIAPEKTEKGVSGFHISGRQSPSRKFLTLSIPYDEQVDHGGDAPEWITRLPDGTWYDFRSDRIITKANAHRYGLPSSRRRRIPIQGTWAADFFRRVAAIFVDTQRLDSIGASPNRAGATFGNPNPKPSHNDKRISLYARQVSAQLSEARRRSLNASFERDQTFAARVLKKARTTTINERDLKERYQRVADQQAELHASGLGDAPVDVRFPEERTNPTERRILNVFLDDWESKLAPLLPVHQKVQSLRRIVDSKFTDKEMHLGERGQIRFRSRAGSRVVPVQALSSGEQHLLAMFTMLLFSAAEGSLVLIDEPEISMHAAWKHSFLEDIEEVAEISKLQIVLATHSSAIINGNWQLVQEIDTSMDPSGHPNDEEIEDEFEVEE